MKTNQTIGQREQKLKVQVHGDDQSPHPGRLHGASLATAMQRPCRPLPKSVENPLSRGGHTHTHEGDSHGGRHQSWQFLYSAEYKNSTTKQPVLHQEMLMIHGQQMLDYFGQP